MINHGFRRLALAHSLLPVARDLPADKADQPRAESTSDPAADTLDDDTPPQDHPAVHM